MAKETKVNEKLSDEIEGKNPEAESINLEDVAKQIAEMLANARKEADEIVADAKRVKEEAEKIVADAKVTVGGELTEEQKKANEERKAYLNELVEVRLFRDNNKYKDDVYVSVNGENCVIKRGIPVKIKRKFALVLENSDVQDFETSQLIEKKSSEFARSEL